jgi:hypothetical protein
MRSTIKRSTIWPIKRTIWISYEDMEEDMDKQKVMKQYYHWKGI